MGPTLAGANEPLRPNEPITKNLHVSEWDEAPAASQVAELSAQPFSID